eukprot:scaffold7312_cov116-Isochrysis_galbana.AAC.6
MALWLWSDRWEVEPPRRGASGGGGPVGRGWDALGVDACAHILSAAAMRRARSAEREDVKCAWRQVIVAAGVGAQAFVFDKWNIAIKYTYLPFDYINHLVCMMSAQ